MNFVKFETNQLDNLLIIYCIGESTNKMFLIDFCRHI